MSLSFYYEFTAPATTPASELETFLRDVEGEAKALGFNPTTVLNVPFDTPERREFANRLGGNFTLQDERLKGVAIPAPGQLRNHDPESGECRLFPRHGVVLVVTDERECETCTAQHFPSWPTSDHFVTTADTSAPDPLFI